jgi:protein phosphatase
MRTRNEDSFFVGHRVWAVADGMGGQAAGDVASRLAAARLRELDNLADLGEADVRSLIHRVNEEIVDYGHQHRGAEGLGSTVCGLAVTDLGGAAHWLTFNVGDSRIYRYRSGEFRLLTSDHNEAADLVRSGAIDAEEARTHPGRSVLTRSLGSHPTPIADIQLFPQHPGEVFLICSDGLYSEVSDKEIARILMEGGQPDWVAGQLVDLAVANGGHDNVTVIVVCNVGSVADAADRNNVEERTIPKLELQDA